MALYCVMASFKMWRDDLLALYYIFFLKKNKLYESKKN